MSVQDYKTAYNDALTEAYGDLEAICARLAELEGRKESIERAAVALQALLNPSEAVAEPLQTATPAPQSVYEISAGKGQPSRTTGDPLQQQIRQALGRAATA